MDCKLHTKKVTIRWTADAIICWELSPLHHWSMRCSKPLHTVSHELDQQMKTDKNNLLLSNMWLHQRAIANHAPNLLTFQYYLDFRRPSLTIEKLLLIACDTKIILLLTRMSRPPDKMTPIFRVPVLNELVWCLTTGKWSSFLLVEYTARSLYSSTTWS